METELHLETSEGARLNEMFACYRQFSMNVFALLRFVEAEVTKAGWVLVKNGGYGVTRNGRATSLVNFPTADWCTTYIGVAFVKPEAAKPAAKGTYSFIGVDGLEVLYFQVRWLTKSPGEPSVWYGRLRVKNVGSAETRKWEEYQGWAFWYIEPEPDSSGGTAGNLAPFKVSFKGTSVTVTGSFTSVPVTQLQNEQDVVTKLVLPALQECLARPG